jgi:membrane associated rhomboid family serine protease
MFPIGDDNSQERTAPVVTYALIALNVLFFLVELSGGDQFIVCYGSLADIVQRSVSCPLYP